MNLLISFGICSIPKLSNYMILLPFTYIAIQWVPTDLNSLRFVTDAPFFILGKLFFDKTPLNLGSFW